MSRRANFFWILSSITLSLAPSCFALETKSASSPYHLLAFQGGVIETFQGAGYSGSFLAGYHPYYQISEQWNIGFNFDLSPQILNSNTRFLSLSYLLSTTYQFNYQWSLQGSVGAQTWSCSSCGTRPAMGPTLRYALSPAWASWVNHLWVHYLAVFRSPTAHQFAAGIGIEF